MVALGIILTTAILIGLPRVGFLQQPQQRGEHGSWSQSPTGDSKDMDPTKSPQIAQSAERGGLGELFSPRDGEYWLAGGEYWKNHLLRETPASSKSFLLVAFWDRSDAGTFYLADALTSFSNLRDGGTGATELLAVELPNDSGSKTTRLPAKIQLPSSSWGVSTPVFFDASYRIWKTLGSPPWPGVVLVDRHTQKVITTWSAKAFIQESEATKERKKKPKVGQIDAAHKETERLAEKVDLTQTLFGKGSFVMDVVVAKGSYFLVDAIGNKIHQLSPDGRVIASFGDGNPGFADGSAAEAQFRFPHRLEFCPSKSTLIVADWGNRAIRAISLDSGAVTTLLRNNQPDALLPVEPIMIGNRLLLTSAFDNKLSVLDCAPETEMNQKTIALPRHWLNTSILASDNSDIAYLSDPESEKLRLLNLANLTQTQIEAGSLHDTKHSSYRTAARKTTVLRNHVLSLAVTNETKQVYLTALRIGSDTAEVYHPDPSKLASVTGIGGSSSSERHSVAWDALAQRICRIEIQDGQEDKSFSLTHCIDYSMMSSRTGAAVQSVEEANPSQHLVMKAGTLSDVKLGFAIAKDEFFSTKDLHLIRTPDNQIYSWNPTTNSSFSYRAPQQAGLASFEFAPVVCKNSARERCRRIHRQIMVEIRTSYTDAEASLNQRLQL